MNPLPRPRLAPGTWGKVTTKKTGTTGDKTWVARGKYRDKFGVAHDFTAHGKTKVIAETHLSRRPDEYGVDRGHGDVTPHSTLTELHAEWWRDKVLAGRSNATYVSYDGVWRRHIEPALGKKQIGQITTATLNGFLDDVRNQGFTSDHKQSRNVLRQIFAHAMMHDVLERDPTAYLSEANRKVYRKGMDRKGRRPEPKALTKADVTRMLNTLRDLPKRPGNAGPRTMPLYEVFATSLMGFRIGEVLGLKRRNVVVDDGPARIVVEATLTPGTKKDWLTGERLEDPEAWEWSEGGKSSGSERVVVVSKTVEEILRDRLSRPGKPDDPLFTSAVGGWLNQNNVRRRWREVRDELGMGDVTPHTFRRTAATLVASTGHEEEAARLLGHTSVRITKDSYLDKTHYTDDFSTRLETLFDGVSSE